MPYTTKGIYYADTDTTMSIAAITAAMATSIGTNLAIPQVKYGTTASQISGTSTAYVDTGLTATIKPAATTNLIAVLASIPHYSTSTSTTSGTDFAVLRAGSIVQTSKQRVAGPSSPTLSGVWTCLFIDAPASTDSLVYKVQYKSPAGTNTSYVNSDNGTAAKSSLLLVELSVS